MTKFARCLPEERGRATSCNRGSDSDFVMMAVILAMKSCADLAELDNETSFSAEPSAQQATRGRFPLARVGQHQDAGP